MKVKFNVSTKNPAGVDGYALFLTNQFLSISREGQRLLDII